MNLGISSSYRPAAVVVAVTALALAFAGSPKASGDGSAARATKRDSRRYSLRSIDRKVAAQPAVSASKFGTLGQQMELPMSGGERLRFVRYSAMTGAPRVVYGDLGKAPSSARTNDRAMSFLEANADALGINVADLEPVRSLEHPKASHYFYRQRYEGLPVFYSEVSVHLDAAEHVRGLTNTFAPVVPQSTQSVLRDSDAFEAAVAALGIADHSTIIEEFLTDPQLGIWPTSDGGRLAWRTLVPSRDPAGTFEVIVDAATGEVIEEPHSLTYSASGTAKVFVPNPIVSERTNTLEDRNDSAAAVPAGAYEAVALTGLDGSGKLIGRYSQIHPDMPNPAVRSDGNFSDLDRSDPQFNEAMVYWAIDFANTTFQGLGFTAANDAAIMDYPIKVYAHDSPRWGNDDNSSFDGIDDAGRGTGILEFGTGGVDDAEDAEIIWHEYGHAVLWNQRPGIRQNVPGEGIGEGWGDYLAAALSKRVSGKRRYHVTIGEWDASSYDSHNPPYLRRLDDPRSYSTLSALSGEWTNGLSWSKALFTLDNAVGTDIALAVALQANFLMDLSPTQPEGAAAMVTADEMLFGGAHRAAIDTAFAAAGITGDTAEPVITSVQFKTAGGASKLIIDGLAFDTGSAVIEVDGIRLATTKYPESYRDHGTSTRIVGTDPNLSTRIPPGTTVLVSVINLDTSARSVPVSFTR